MTNISITMNETETPSQQSQWMRDNLPPGQARTNDQARPSQNLDIHKLKDDFVSKLIIRNNESNGDTGVHSLLLALRNLDDKAKIVELNKINKGQIQAGMGFLEGILFNEAKVHYHGIKVDELRAKIVAKFKLMCPMNCNVCKSIYNHEESLVRTCVCFLCNVRMCPTCSPCVTPAPRGYVPVCNDCMEIHGHRSCRGCDRGWKERR